MHQLGAKAGANFVQVGASEKPGSNEYPAVRQKGYFLLKCGLSFYNVAV